MSEKTISTLQQRKSVQNANALHDWPKTAGECSEQTWQVYANNQSVRAYDDWQPSDLFELARLSRMQVDAVDLQDQLDDEGYIVMGGKNGTTKVENPLSRALGTLNSNINALARRLGMTDASQNDKRSRGNRAQQEREAARAVNTGDDATDRTKLM